MARKYFGTDGIRGETNKGAMTAAMAMRVAEAAGAHFRRGDHRHRVVIGKDTRLSGYMMESALVAGFTSMGVNVIQTGPLPTPAIAMLTREMRADLGVMISASHNPYRDNGIKLFGPDGFKLSDEDEAAIEALMGCEPDLVPASEIGRARRIEDARGRYIHAVKQSVSDEIRFDDLKVVVDCANGAAYQVAPSAIWELGAEVITLGVEPNGTNINDGVGSTSLDAVKAKVVETGADIGIALDGDADRLIVIDEKGETVDGDHGRIEHRKLWCTHDVDWFKDKDQWPGLRSFVMVESQRTLGEKTTRERRYFISSLDGTNAKRAAHAIRTHWGIENSVHWILDVAFNEDRCRVREGNAAENMSLLRRIALNLLKNNKSTKVGVKAKRLKAGWDEQYLLDVLKTKI